MEVEGRLAVQFTESASRDYDRLDKRKQNAVDSKIEQHQTDPFRGAKKMVAPQIAKIGSYVWRAGGLRIFFDYDQEEGVILITTIKNRNESYKTRRRR